VAGHLNHGANVTIFGKIEDSGDNKEKIKKLIDKIKDTLPKAIE